MSKTRFWLIRHGETEWNANRRLQGWLDIPLSAVGARQAEQLRDYLQSSSFTAPVNVVVSSDLSRAFETARIAAGHFGHAIEANDALRERCYGIYEGQDWHSLNAEQAGSQVNFRDPQQAIERGETLHDFAHRITQAFEDIARRYPGRNILAFSHGGVIDIAWRKASNLALEVKRHEPILNASINQFSIDQDMNWQIKDWAQAEHLEIPALDDIL
ncbi:histidine phosphatase family protein [Alcaligenaceae bacterium]|nr:histidine phosphatase family protein [Alcaligenaceae bacterium]